MKMENYKLKSRIQNQDEEMVRLVDQQPVTRSTLATNSYSVDQYTYMQSSFVEHSTPSR